MKRKMLLALLFTLAVGLLFAGCGAAAPPAFDNMAGGGAGMAPATTTAAAAATTAAATTMPQAMAMTAAPQAANAVQEYALESGEGALLEIHDQTDGAVDTTDSEAPEEAADEGRKEIKNAWVTLVVKDVPAIYGAVSEIVESLGGYEFSKTENNHAGNIYMNLTIKLPPQSLTEFETRLRSSAGENAVTHFQLTSEDITASYYDVAARLESMRLSLRQYLAILGKATVVEDILAIQREITWLQAEIDGLQGQINAWDKLVSYATIQLTIETAPDPIVQSQNSQWSFNTSSEIFNAMGNGFIGTGNTVYGFIVNFFIILVSLLPALVPLALIVVLILYIRKRARKTGKAVAKPRKGKAGDNAVHSDSSAVSSDAASPDETGNGGKQPEDVTQNVDERR